MEYLFRKSVLTLLFSRFKSSMCFPLPILLFAQLLKIIMSYTPYQINWSTVIHFMFLSRIKLLINVVQGSICRGSIKPFSLRLEIKWPRRVKHFLLLIFISQNRVQSHFPPIITIELPRKLKPPATPKTVHLENYTTIVAGSW